MDRETAQRLHEGMLLTRLTEERLVLLYRQGATMGSVYRSMGQEATACATAMALQEGDIIGPLIRNLGSMLVRGVSPLEVFLQYLGRATGPTGGREHNNHFGGIFGVRCHMAVTLRIFEKADRTSEEIGHGFLLSYPNPVRPARTQPEHPHG